MITMMPAAPAGVLYGAITDYFGSLYTKEYGFRVSFAVAGALIVLGIGLSLVLPRRPRADEGTPELQPPA
jgi:hypothetical protein